MPIMTAGTRAEVLEKIFTQEVQRYALQANISPSQALKEFCETNPQLWREYSEQVRELSRQTPSGSRLAEAAQSRLDAEVNAYRKEHGCSQRDALCEVTKIHPDLWATYSAEVMPVQGTPLPGNASTALAAEAAAYAKENQVSLAVALSEVCKSRPDLLREYREEIPTIV